MKTNHQLIGAAMLLCTLFLSQVSQAENPVSTPIAKPENQMEGPGKPRSKKCRKCAPWLPERLFKKGQWDATLGVGAVPTFLMDGAKIQMLPLSLGLDYRFSEKFSLGVVAGHSVSESKPKIFSDGVQASWMNRFYHLALRPAVHVTSVEDWDFYGGFSIGLQSSRLEGKSNATQAELNELENHLGISPNRTNAAFSGFAGLRYVVSPKWTVGGEVGFGVSILTVGVTRLLN